MASPVIQLKRGVLADLPGLRAGEPGFTTDSYDLYVGIDSTTATNQFVGSGRYWTVNSASTGSGVNLVEGTSNGTSFITLKSPDSLSGIVTYTMPGTDGSNGHILKTDGSGNLSFGAPSSSSFTLAADSGENDTFNTGETLTFAGGEGIDTSVSNNLITISAEDATETNKGVATFDGTDFTVTSGDVTLNAERIQDIAGAMFSSNTETGVTATYQDSDGTIDLVVSITTSEIAASALVIESEGIGSNDNDTTIPTSAAVKDYIDGQLGGGGSQAGTVATQSSSTDATHYLTFVTDNNGSATQEAIKTDAGITYNPSSNLLTVGGEISVTTLDIGGTNVTSTAAELNVLDGVTAFVDEDNMASNSATSIPSQQSVKAYVDAQLTAQDVDFAGDSGTGAVDLDSQSLTIAGTSNEIETSASGQTLTVGLPAAVTVTTSVTTPTVKASAVRANDGTAAITITDSTGAVACNQNLTVGGNLIVNGSTTQVNTSQTTIEDQLLELGMVDGSAPSSDLNKDIGVIFNYYTDAAKKSAVYWDDSASRIVVSAVVTESTGVLTNTTAGALEIGSLYLNDCAGNTQVISCSGSTRNLENITIDGGSF